MLTHEENELLTRIGPGTLMGAMMRRYWVPALLSEELVEPDGGPVRVRLMGEQLVAFRDTRGRVGLLAERCPHRQASLALARNEEEGLRCIYHGWKLDFEGNVLDTPCEPAFRWTDSGGRGSAESPGLGAQPQGSSFVGKIRHTAYPCIERAGVIFAYLGPRDKVPPFPDFLWLKLPPLTTTPSRRWRSAITPRPSRAASTTPTPPSCTARGRGE